MSTYEYNFISAWNLNQSLVGLGYNVHKHSCIKADHRGSTDFPDPTAV